MRIEIPSVVFAAGADVIPESFPYLRRPAQKAQLLTPDHETSDNPALCFISQWRRRLPPRSSRPEHFGADILP